MGRKKGSILTKEERLERSRLRAEEHHRRKVLMLIVVLFLYVVVPLLWYGAIEFGLAHPIRTPGLDSALSSARLLLLISILYLVSELFLKRSRPKDTKKERQQTDAPTATA